MVDYTIDKCSLNANKFKIYVNFLEFQIKLMKQNTAYASYWGLFFFNLFGLIANNRGDQG